MQRAVKQWMMAVLILGGLGCFCSGGQWALHDDFDGNTVSTKKWGSEVEGSGVRPYVGNGRLIAEMPDSNGWAETEAYLKEARKTYGIRGEMRTFALGAGCSFSLTLDLGSKYEARLELRTGRAMRFAISEGDEGLAMPNGEHNATSAPPEEPNDVAIIVYSDRVELYLEDMVTR